MKIKIIAVALAALGATLAQAQVSALATREMSRMNTPERIEAGLQKYASSIYRLAAAKAPRTLIKDDSADIPLRVKIHAREVQALVLIDKGRIVYESYASGVKPDSVLHGYSIAKSWTALAVGEALCAGKIKSLDEVAQTYAPQLAGTVYGLATLRNLLRYTSGAEDPGGNGYTGLHSISDFGSMMEQSISLAEMIRKHAGTSRFKQGEKFSYNGLNSNALSLVIRGATGMALPAWFEATVWTEAGAEYPGAWFMDKEGNGVAEVLTFAAARDHARIGLYILERLNGKAGSACIQDFLQQAVRDVVGKGYWPPLPAFGLGLHLGLDGMPWMAGVNGQRVGVHLTKERVFTALSDAELRSSDIEAQAILNR